MDSLPGPSRIKDDSPKQTNKKLKSDDVQEETEFNYSTTIDNLPDEMILEIFKYLSIQDRIRIQRVCRKWFQIVKSEVLWKYVVLLDTPNTLFINILRILPSCVSHFECHNSYVRFVLPFSLPEFMAKLHEQCPSLKTLILVNVVFINNFTIPDFKSPVLSESACSVKCAQIVHLNKTIETGDKKEDGIGMLDAAFPELKILSFTQVCEVPSFPPIFSCSLFPKVTVLDLSYSIYFCESLLKKDLLFPLLHDLEELYLRGSLFRNKELDIFKNLKKVRVLDLGFTNVNGDIISLLQENCTCLEELYLCSTEIKDVPKSSETKEFFPRLHTLCLSRSSITRRRIKKLLFTCPSIKVIYVSDPKITTDLWYLGLSKDLKEKIDFRFNEKNSCNHFLRRERWHRSRSALCTTRASFMTILK